MMTVRLKRFPQDVRRELNKIANSSSWQALRKEFSVDTYTGLTSEGLDLIPDLVDSDREDLRKDVRRRMAILKKMAKGDHQAFKGKSKVGFYSYFYRFWIVGQRRADGLYDIVFAHISREEEFDLFLFMSKVAKGTAFALSSVPGIVSSLSQRTCEFIRRGLFEEDETPSLPQPTNQTQGSPFTDLTQHLGDRLTDYEMVEDLIERGMLAERQDGTLYIQLQ